MTVLNCWDMLKPPLVKNSMSKPRIRPTASIISQIMVACLKFSLKDLKKDRIVYPSSFLASFSVT